LLNEVESKKGKVGTDVTGIWTKSLDVLNTLIKKGDIGDSKACLIKHKMIVNEVNSS